MSVPFGDRGDIPLPGVELMEGLGLRMNLRFFGQLTNT